MSDMQVFYGVFKKSDEHIEVADTDDFYELEQRNNCHYVKVRGQLYEFYGLEDVDSHGFSVVIEPSEETRCILYWYNGGAGIHEVMEALIEKTLEK